MKSCFEDDHYYHQQITRNTDCIEERLKRYNDLRKSHFGIEDASIGGKSHYFLSFDADAIKSILVVVFAFNL